MTRLSEHQALEICILRSIEQAADNGGLWSVADAKEATQEARDLTGAGASFSDLLARRAQWAMNLIAQRTPAKAVQLREPKWPGLAASGLCAVAFLAGCMTDYLSPRQQVQVIEYSLLGLILWNLFVYLWTVVSAVQAASSGGRKPAGLFNEWMAKLRFRSALQSGAQRKRPWLMACEESWVQLARPLTGARMKIAFHMAAICFAAGVVTMLYLRGLPTEYRPGVAGSTWLDIRLMQQLFTLIMTPGAWLFGLQMPEIAAVDQVLASGDGLSLARALFHLHAASVFAWVLLPRSVLVLASALHRWQLRRSFPLPLNAAYFTALRAAWRGQKIAVVVVPFRYEMTSQGKATLQRMLERTYGMSVEIDIQPSVQMGDDAKDWKRVINKAGHVAVFTVFNVVATAESNTHGVLLTRLRAVVEAETPVLAIVDTGAFPAGNEERLRSRQRQWRQILDKVRAEPLFLNLQSGDDPQLASFQKRLNSDG